MNLSETVRLKRTKKIAATLAVLGLVSTAGNMTWAAFSATTANSGNSFAAGTVALTDNDAASAMFALAGMKPGDTDSGCIQVTYSGTLPAGVHLYGATSGTGLDQHLDLTVTRGTISSGAFDDCTNFTADAGGGVLYTGTLQGYPDTYSAGIVDPTAAWATNEVHAYRFTITLRDENTAQGKDATQVFTWEARS